MREGLYEDWFALTRDITRWGEQYLHSKGWGYRSLEKRERRAVLSAHMHYRYHDDLTAECENVSYARHASDGEITETGQLTSAEFLERVQNIQDADGQYVNCLLLVTNPSAFVQGLPVSKYEILYDQTVPHHEQNVPRKGEWLTVTQSLPGDDSSTTFQITKTKARGRVSRTDVWCVSTLTARCWPLHDAECQPCPELLRACVRGFLAGLKACGLRGSSGESKIQRTIASQGRVTYQSSFYSKDEGEILGSPSTYHDYVRGARGRFMSTEQRMPERAEYYRLLHHYDLRSAYLSLMTEPVPATWIRGFSKQDITERGISLGWLRERYAGRRDVRWIAEIQVDGTCPHNGSVPVTKWVCDDSSADYSSVFTDDIIPLWVGVYTARPSLRRFAEHLIRARYSPSVDDSVASVIKAVSVTLHMSLGYMGESYHRISRHSDEYAHYEEHKEDFLVTHPSETKPAFHCLDYYPNRPRSKGVTKQTYGTKIGSLQEYVMYEGNPYQKRDGRIPHLATWCLSNCSMRVLNMTAAANRSGGYVPWIHTDGIRSTHPIADEHLPVWWREKPDRVRYETEREVCLWPDGTRMIQGEIDVMPGRLKPLRDGGRIRALCSTYRHGQPVRWMRACYDDIATAKAHEQDLLINMRQKERQYEAVRRRETVRKARRRHSHESLCYDTIGLRGEQYETTTPIS